MTTAWTEKPPGVGRAEGDAAAPSGVRMRRNASALAGGQLVTWTMTLLWTLVVPRALGPAGLGIFVAALSVSGVFGIVLGLGTRTYLVREIVMDRTAAPGLVGSAIVLRLALTPIFAVAVVVYAWLAGQDHEEVLVLYLVAAATALTLLAEPMQAGFQAIERMKYLAYSDVINKSSQGLLGIALVLVGFRTVGIAATMAVVAGLVIALNAFWLRRFLAIDLRTSVRRLADMARESAAYWAFGVFSMLYLWIDTIMLSLMTDQKVVGWYGAPIRLFQTLMVIPVLTSTVWLPRLVAAFKESPGRLHQTARVPLELVLLLSVPISAGTAMLADPGIHLLYGSAYAKAVPVMIILGFCFPPMYLNIVLSTIVVAAKRQMAWTKVMALATVLNPPLNLVLIPLTEHRYGNGAIGAAISLLLTELIIVAVGFAIVGPGVLDRPAIRRCALATIASAAMFGVAFVARPLGTPIAIAAGCLTLVILTLTLRIATPEELALARGALMRMRSRRAA
jgi:O-antigen/teichoic acid export membrane protein